MSNLLLLILKQDLEKFFDRILTELVVAGLIRFGVPRDGLIEMKLDDMIKRMAHILTSCGVELAQFLVGLLQGAGWSPELTKQVASMLLDAARIDEETGEVLPQGDERTYPYELSELDKNDQEATAQKEKSGWSNQLL